jgi:hypothetical protein
MRVPIHDLLKDPVLRRDLMIRSLIAIQAREGRDVSYEDAARAYDAVQKEQRSHESV